MSKRWHALHPSATVGVEISIQEAGYCTVCGQPYEDGESWVAYELVEEDQRYSLETATVHGGRGCARRLTDPSGSPNARSLPS